MYTALLCFVLLWLDTVYPKKYAHGFCFAVLCCGYTLTDFPISIRLSSLALWQSNDCPSASKATLMNMDKYFMWIHYERLHNHNKAKHNKTVCIFLGIYCNLFYWIHVNYLLISFVVASPVLGESCGCLIQLNIKPQQNTTKHESAVTIILKMYCIFIKQHSTVEASQDCQMMHRKGQYQWLSARI